MSGTAEMNAWITRVLGIEVLTAAAKIPSDAAAIDAGALSRLGVAAARLPRRPDRPGTSVRTDSLVGRVASLPPAPEPKDLLAQFGRLAPEFVLAVLEEPASTSTALHEGADLPRQDWMLEFGDRFNSLMRNLRDWRRLLGDAQAASDAAATAADTGSTQEDLIEVYATARNSCLEARELVMTEVRSLATEFRQAQQAST
jgi:hypothetical protein